MIPLTVYIFLLIELIAVAYVDILHRKISNYWIIVNILTFVTLLVISPQVYQLIIPTFFYSSVFLIMGFILFLLNVMGGGDSKFLFSLYLLIPVSLQESAFLNLIYSTLFIGGILFLTNIARNWKQIIFAIKYKDMGTLKIVIGRKFAFSPVILVAWIVFGWENYKYFF